MVTNSENTEFKNGSLRGRKMKKEKPIFDISRITLQQATSFFFSI